MTAAIDLQPLSHLADQDTDQGTWTNLVRAHGIDAVVWACARCLTYKRPGDRATAREAKRVLDGRAPFGTDELYELHGKRNRKQKAKRPCS